MLPLLLALSLGLAPASPPQQRLITTMGDAKVSFKPNQVIASVLLTGQHKDAAVARRMVDEKMARLLKGVKEAGVEPTNILINDLGATPDYRGNEVIGQIVNRVVTLTITDMARVDEALMAAVKAGGVPNAAVTIQNTEHQSFATRARVAAATAARERAKGLTEALGARLGLPAVITDHTGTIEAQNVGTFTVAPDGVVSTSFGSRTMTVASQVTVQFDVEAP